MLAASAARIIVSSASREFAMRTEGWFLSTLPVPCGSFVDSVCGTSGRRITLMPMPEISDIVCAIVRLVPAPPFAQKVLPTYCSIGAPLGFVGSLGGSCRPSRPNHEPQCTGNSVPFFVMRPLAFTRNSALPPDERDTLTEPAVYPLAVSANVDVAAVVPAAAVKLTGTPVFHVVALSCTDAGAEITVLPERVIVT